MIERIRQPLYRATKPTAAASIYADNPATLLEAMYRRIWETSMHDMPFVNNALTVAAVGFRQHEGDWVGAVITPWFINLLLLPGGGALWSDMASGDRIRIPFPVGELEFIADFDPGGDIPAYQYCTLFAPVSQFTVQEGAVGAAEAALEALFSVPEPKVIEETPNTVGESDCMPGGAEIPDRRAFLRNLAGWRQQPR